MLIAQVTDIHIGFDPGAGEAEGNRRRFEVMLATMLAAPDRPDLVVASGDLTDRAEFADMAVVAEGLGRLGCPVLPLVGNHDSREAVLSAFPDMRLDGGFLQYAREHEGLTILCLDTLEEGRHGGAFCDARAAWLRARLEEGRGRPHVVFMHHPPVASGIEWMDPGADEAWIARFAAAIAGFDDTIRAIHCGHLHRLVSARIHGIPVGIAPSVAPPLALDLTPIEPARPDGRALITDRAPGYALHRWARGELVTHYASCTDHAVIARFDAGLAGMVGEMFAERGGAGA